jgi:alkyl hydroperoxide reductase subunit AhpF
MSPEVEAQVRQFLAPLEQPVTLEFYGKDGDPASDAMAELLKELNAITPKLIVDVKPGPGTPVPPEEPDEIESSVTLVKKDGVFTGIRYLGFPGGREFGPFLEALIEVSKGAEPQVSPDTRQLIAALTEPLHLEVFVTPT